MRKVEYWESFDGRRFEAKKECEDYEREHPFFDKSHIKFYSNNGYLIEHPCDCVFMDSNRFEVYNEETLLEYIKYCENLRIKAPRVTSFAVPYPLHYRFICGDWECLEESVAEITYALKTDFNNDIYEEGYVCHNKIVGED